MSLLGKSAEHTHEGDLVRETQPVVAAPPQGDLASVGLEKAGIADRAAGLFRPGHPSRDCQGNRDRAGQRGDPQLETGRSRPAGLPTRE